MKLTREAMTDLLAFINVINVEVCGNPVPFREVIAPFQRECFAAIAPGVRFAAGHPVRDGEKLLQRAYWQRSKGSSKSTDSGVIVSHWLIASAQKRSGVLVAVDRDQARIVLDAVDMLCRLNPSTIGRFLEVQNSVIRNVQTGSEVQAIASDQRSSHGLKPTLVVVDELTCHPSSGMFESLWAGAGKTRNSLFIIISNAGVRGHWSEDIWRKVQTDPLFHCHETKGLSPWLDVQQNEHLRRYMSESEYARVYLNEWGDGVSGAITAADLAAATTLRSGMPGGERFRTDFIAFAGLDLSLRRDRSALVTCAIPRGERRILVVDIKSWKPTPGRDIDLTAVEKAVLQVNREYGCEAVYYDPHQAGLLSQRLRQRGVSMREMGFVPKNLTLMAESILSTFRDQIISIWPHEEFIRDLRRLEIKDILAGPRLTAVSDAEGHADTAIALSICLPAAAQIANRQLYCTGTTSAPSPMQVAIPSGKHGVFLRGQRQRLDRGGRNPGWRRA